MFVLLDWCTCVKLIKSSVPQQEGPVSPVLEGLLLEDAYVVVVKLKKPKEPRKTRAKGLTKRGSGSDPPIESQQGSESGSVSQ